MKKLLTVGAVLSLLLATPLSAASPPPRPPTSSASTQMPSIRTETSYDGRYIGIQMIAPPGRYLYDHETSKGVYYRYDGFVTLISLAQFIPDTPGGIFLPFDPSKPPKLWYPGVFGPNTFDRPDLVYTPEGPGFPAYRPADRTAGVCTKYIGTVVAPETFDAVAAMLKPVALKKDEFETSDAFQARAAATRAKLPAEITLAIDFDPSKAIYNADNKEFTIDKRVVGSAIFDWSPVFGPAAPFQGQLEYGDGVGSNVDIEVSSKSITTGTYSAQNSYGANATIAKIERTEYLVFDKMAESPLKILLGNISKEPVLFRLSAPIDEARTLKPNLRMAIILTPKAPFFVIGAGRQAQTPTVASPLDVTETIQAVVGNIRCLLLTDNTGKVLAARQTN